MLTFPVGRFPRPRLEVRPPRPLSPMSPLPRTRWDKDGRRPTRGGLRSVLCRLGTLSFSVLTTGGAVRRGAALGVNCTH